MEGFDTGRWAKRRRPFDALEAKVVRLHTDRGEDGDAQAVVDALRYAISFARLTHVRTRDGVDVDVSGPLALHAGWVRRTLESRMADIDSVWPLSRELPELLLRTRRSRVSLLEHVPIDRDSLEAEVTTRLLAVASGGGGGAGYVYPGVYDQLERAGLVPDLMVGTSIGSLMSMFRARRHQYDFAALVAAARRLSWGGVFQILEAANRYGLPATLRLRLRNALGPLFVRSDGEAMQLSDMEIPLYIVATGITVDALKHDLAYYEHLLDDDVRKSGIRAGLAGSLKAITVFREFLSRPDTLKCIVLGRDADTQDFDVLDAAGFSSAVPAVIHYDVLREDPRMHRVLDTLYATYGITRLGEGGLTSNVPARAAWETIASGAIADGRRNVFVLALDCFAPTRRRLGWFPLQKAVQASNVDSDRRYADLYVAHQRTLSPMNLVPSVRDAMTAVRWGREAISPHMPFVRAMCAPIRVLSDGPTR